MSGQQPPPPEPLPRWGRAERLMRVPAALSLGILLLPTFTPTPDGSRLRSGECNGEGRQRGAKRWGSDASSCGQRGARCARRNGLLAWIRLEWSRKLLVANVYPARTGITT
jgi:hypothetical protein